MRPLGLRVHTSRGPKSRNDGREEGGGAVRPLPVLKLDLALYLALDLRSRRLGKFGRGLLEQLAGQPGLDGASERLREGRLVHPQQWPRLRECK